MKFKLVFRTDLFTNMVAILISVDLRDIVNVGCSGGKLACI